MQSPGFFEFPNRAKALKFCSKGPQGMGVGETEGLAEALDTAETGLEVSLIFESRRTFRRSEFEEHKTNERSANCFTQAVDNQ